MPLSSALAAWGSPTKCVDRAVGERRRHVGRWQVDELDVARRQALLVHQLGDDEVLVRELAGPREHLAAQVAQVTRGRVLADHHGRAVPVAEVDDLDRHPLRAQYHRQRRQQERRLDLAALERLDRGRKVRKRPRPEAGRGGRGPGREVGDRTGEMAGHRQEADVELAMRGVGAPGHPRPVVQDRQHGQERGGDRRDPQPERSHPATVARVVEAIHTRVAAAT